MHTKTFRVDPTFSDYTIFTPILQSTGDGEYHILFLKVIYFGSGYKYCNV